MCLCCYRMTNIFFIVSNTHIDFYILISLFAWLKSTTKNPWNLWKSPKDILDEFLMCLNISENVLELDYLNNNYISNSGGITQIVSFHKGNKNFGTIVLQSFGTWLLKLVSLSRLRSSSIFRIANSLQYLCNMIRGLSGKQSRVEYLGYQQGHCFSASF